MSGLADRADEIAKEIISIAASSHFGELRSDMIERASMKAMLGDTSTPTVLKPALAAAVIYRLGIALVEFTDEIKAVSA